jgi:hypothetical protein
MISLTEKYKTDVIATKEELDEYAKLESEGKIVGLEKYERYIELKIKVDNLIEKCKSSIEYFARHFMKIKIANGKERSLTEAELDFCRMIDKAKAEGKNIIIHRGRRVITPEIQIIKSHFKYLQNDNNNIK